MPSSMKYHAAQDASAPVGGIVIPKGMQAYTPGVSSAKERVCILIR